MIRIGKALLKPLRAEIIATGNVDVGVRLELAFIDVGVHVHGTITREEP